MTDKYTKPKDKSDSDNSANAESVSKEVESQENAPNIVTRITLVVLAICFVYFIWYLIADRHTPYTDQARIRGMVIPISATVPGRVTEVRALSGQVIEKGEVLIKVDTRRYQAAVEKAESELESAGLDVGVATAAISSAQARLADAIANRETTQKGASRILALVEQGIYAKVKGEQIAGELEQAHAKVDQAEAEIRKEEAALGKKGQDNFRVKAALSNLASAQLDLADATITAPTRGGISNVDIEVGHYANKGQALLTFIVGDEVWVEAYLRENSLANIKVGNPVDIALDISPGKVFEGQVSSIGFGVKWEQSSKVGELQSINVNSSWLRDAQRFPVLIRFKGQEARGLRRIGGQADVIIYTGDSAILNVLGKVQINVNSYFSYLY